MSTLKDIEQATSDFFAMHWDKDASTEPLPWKSNYAWKGSVPYHDMAGVYALIDGEGEVVYVGLGASIGNSTYPEHGISRRLVSHVLRTDRTIGNGHYKPRSNWQEVKDIASIGFPSEYAYLAPSLEDYLIRRFEPVRNNIKKNKL